MLNPLEFNISDHNRFSPSTEILFRRPYPRLGKGVVFKCIQNPTQEELRNGRYKPRLTAMLRPCPVTRALVVNLKVEFSAPKLLCGNNFDELTDADFENLVQALVRILYEMGVHVAAATLKQAQVSKIDYSKNFILSDFTRCRHVLDELRKLNVWRRLDVNAKDYRNDGYALKWHGNSYELCLYDKVKDLEQAKISSKRAIDRHQEGQLHFFDAMQGKQAQVLRMELRLTKPKLKSLLAELGLRREPTFCKLFSSALSQKILTHFWNRLHDEASKSDILRADLSQPDKYVEKLMATYPAIKPKEAVALYGTASLMQKTGDRGFENLFPSSQRRTVRRLAKACKNRTPRLNPRWQAALQMQEQLQKFAPTSLDRDLMQ